MFLGSGQNGLAPLQRGYDTAKSELEESPRGALRHDGARPGLSEPHNTGSMIIHGSEEEHSTST